MPKLVGLVIFAATFAISKFLAPGVVGLGYWVAGLVLAAIFAAGYLWDRSEKKTREPIGTQTHVKPSSRPIIDAELTHYEVLGVASDAELEVIKAAFRALAKKYHPDVASDPQASARFRKIGEAHAVLSDPAARAEYDRSLSLQWQIGAEETKLDKYGSAERSTPPPMEPPPPQDLQPRQPGILDKLQYGAAALFVLGGASLVLLVLVLLIVEK